MTEIPETVLRWKPLVEKNRYQSNIISVDLVLAIMSVENEPGDPWAVRYEPAYQYFYDHKRRLALFDINQSVTGNRIRAAGVLGQTEFHTQSQSYGLLQLMGAAARERGFMAPYLTELCNPEANIIYATRHLYEWGFSYGRASVKDALVRWNGADEYAVKVMDKLTTLV